MSPPCPEQPSLCKIPNFHLIQKFCGNVQFPQSFGLFDSSNCAIPQNLHSRKLDEITVFYAVHNLNTTLNSPLSKQKQTEINQ